MKILKICLGIALLYILQIYAGMALLMSLPLRDHDGIGMGLPILFFMVVVFPSVAVAGGTGFAIATRSKQSGKVGFLKETVIVLVFLAAIAGTMIYPANYFSGIDGSDSLVELARAIADLLWVIIAALLGLATIAVAMLFAEAYSKNN